jgi:hypothetical protein
VSVGSQHSRALGHQAEVFKGQGAVKQARHVMLRYSLVEYKWVGMYGRNSVAVVCTGHARTDEIQIGVTMQHVVVDGRCGCRVM